MGRTPDTSEAAHRKKMIWRGHLARKLITIWGLRSSVHEQETYPALNTSRGSPPGNKQHKLQAGGTRRDDVIPVPAIIYLVHKPQQ